MSGRVSCESDLSDERWTLVEPVLTAWKAAHPSVSGHQGRYELREIVNAILYPYSARRRRGAGIVLLDQVAADTGSVKKALVDRGFKKAVVDCGEQVGEAGSSRSAASAMTCHAEPGSSDMAAPTRLRATASPRTDR